MAAKKITLKYPSVCADCGADLTVGTPALWYGRGKVYGLTCHDKKSGGSGRGRITTYYSPETGNSWSQNSRGRCEDAPCCGCCG